MTFIPTAHYRGGKHLFTVLIARDLSQRGDVDKKMYFGARQRKQARQARRKWWIKDETGYLKKATRCSLTRRLCIVNDSGRVECQMVGPIIAAARVQRIKVPAAARCYQARPAADSSAAPLNSARRVWMSPTFLRITTTIVSRFLRL